MIAGGFAVAAGEKIAAFALSEPEAGSDVAAMTTTAQDGRITGTKTWISNGGIADFYTVFARAPEGITAYVVEAEDVEIAERIDVMAPHPLATLEFHDAPARLTEESFVDLGNEDIPYSRYFDPAFFDAEMKHMWSKTWQWACREEHVREPGAYIVYEIGAHSVLVMRAHDGSIKA